MLFDRIYYTNDNNLKFDLNLCDMKQMYLKWSYLFCLFFYSYFNYCFFIKDFFKWKMNIFF